MSAAIGLASTESVELSPALHKLSHDIRGAVTTLLLITRHIGAPSTPTAEQSRLAAKEKLRALAGLADQIDALANGLR